MLKKRWLNVVRVLSVHHPCLSGDVQRCQRWPGQRLFHVALCGSVLIESGHGLLSGGYACDAVPSDQTVVEHDTFTSSPLDSPVVFSSDLPIESKTPPIGVNEDVKPMLDHPLVL